MERLSASAVRAAAHAIDPVRGYLINARDARVAPRLAPGINALIEYFEEYGSIPWAEAVAVIMKYGDDLAAKTADNKLHAAVRAGFLNKEGSFDRKSGKDNRTLTLIDWPEPGTAPVPRPATKGGSKRSRCPVQDGYPHQLPDFRTSVTAPNGYTHTVHRCSNPKHRKWWDA